MARFDNYETNDMSTVQSRMIWVLLCFLLLFVTGFWMRVSGRPLSSLILNIYKLIAVGVFVFLVVALYRTNRLGPLGN